MRNKVNLLFIAALAIPFYSFSSTTTITNEAAPAITVTRILDGDTLEVKDDGELIRIRLVDMENLTLYGYYNAAFSCCQQIFQDIISSFKIFLSYTKISTIL